jgi:hypothetical protein
VAKKWLAQKIRNAVGVDSSIVELRRSTERISTALESQAAVINQLQDELKKTQGFVLDINHRSLVLDEMGPYLSVLGRINSRLLQLEQESVKAAEQSAFNAEAAAVLVAALERSLRDLKPMS